MTHDKRINNAIHKNSSEKNFLEEINFHLHENNRGNHMS